jgi:hypothetical protein
VDLVLELARARDARVKGLGAVEPGRSVGLEKAVARGGQTDGVVACSRTTRGLEGHNLVEAVLNDPTNASAGYTVFHRRRMGVASFTASSVQARDHGLCVHDTWKPASRVSLTIGLRAEFVGTRDLVFDTDIERGWNLGPRLGAAWLLTPDARNVLRAGYSVLHDMPQAVLIASVGATRVARTDDYDNDLDGVRRSAMSGQGAG